MKKKKNSAFSTVENPKNKRKESKKKKEKTSNALDPLLPPPFIEESRITYMQCIYVT